VKKRNTKYKTTNEPTTTCILPNVLFMVLVFVESKPLIVASSCIKKAPVAIKNAERINPPIYVNTSFFAGFVPKAAKL